MLWVYDIIEDMKTLKLANWISKIRDRPKMGKFFKKVKTFNKHSYDAYRRRSGTI